MSFYFAELKDIDADRITLTGPEAKHLAVVMRARLGERVTVTDGAGSAYACAVENIDKRSVALQILHMTRNVGEPSRQITLAVGLSAVNKFEMALQMGCEIGVSAFVPLFCERSKVKIEDPRRAQAKLTRWRETLKAALKQSERTRLPEISAPQSFSDYILSANSFPHAKLIADPQVASDESGSALETLTRGATPAFILIGPEAGFSRDEVELAQKHGWRGFRVGSSVLRAETAVPALAALALLSKPA